MPLWYRIARIWLPVAVAATAVCGLVAVAVQQSYRTGLNDPQVQLARDAAARLNAGATPSSIVNSPTVDADKSFAPFLIIYSPTNVVLASGATLDGAAPVPPPGLLQAARNALGGSGRLGMTLAYSSAAENRVTWQPRQGVRLASVSVAANNGAVALAARNMREVENRESQLEVLVVLGWVAAVSGAFVAVVAIELLGRRLFVPPAGD